MTDPAALASQAVDAPALVALLQRMVQTRSYSARKEEGTLARWLRDHMESLGFDSRLQEVEPNRFNVISTWKGTGGGNSLMFNGHLDTNPSGEGWTVDPLGGVVDETFIYGIGVSNMKAADAAYVGGVMAAMTSGFRPRGDVVIAHVVGELQGGVGSHHLVKSGVFCDRFVVGEPTDLDIVTMHAGSIECELVVFGRTRHLSKMEEAADALAIMIEAIGVLRTMPFSGPQTLAHQAVRRVGIGVMRAGLGETFEEWRPSLMADRAMIKFSPRWSTGQTPESVVADIQAAMERLVARHPGASFALKRSGDAQRLVMGPFEVDPEADIVQHARAAYLAERGREPPLGAVGPARFYGTDAYHLMQGGMVGIVCGPGGRYNTMPDERVDLVDLIDAAKIYARMVVAVCR